MSSAQNAFDFVLKTQGRIMTYERNGGDETDQILVCPSNYFRNLAGIEETQFQGREFVISKTVFDNSVFADKIPHRSDVIVDPDFGDSTISEVRELMVFGIIIGYRIRTS